jgi:hypothetical protein
VTPFELRDYARKEIDEIGPEPAGPETQELKGVPGTWELSAVLA